MVGGAIFIGSILWLACGKESKVEEASPVGFVPEYASVPEDAPLPEQMKEAAAVIDRELLEEQEKFYLKNVDGIRALYSDEAGDLLVSEDSLRAMQEMMLQPNRTRLKIKAEKFYFRAPEPANDVSPKTHRGVVYLLEGTVPAQGDFSGEVRDHRVYLHAQFAYEIQKPDSFEIERTFRIDRYIIYRKGQDGRWNRIRIEERAPGSGA